MTWAMSDTSLSNLHQSFVKLYNEIREEGSEFDFRYSLVDHVFTDELGWSRTEGNGHVNFEDEQKDLLFFDDSNPPFPVVVCETKRPSHELQLSDRDQLEAYIKGVGSAEYGILTNGHHFQLYEYRSTDRTITTIDRFSIDEIAESEFEDLTAEQLSALSEIEKLRRDRFVNIGDAEYFRKRYQEVPVQYQPETDDEGYELFLNAVKQSLDILTNVLLEFFEDYRNRDKNSYPKQFLDTTYPDWKDWREFTGKSEDARESFCRETAYITLNRALFARIAEDKEIVGNTRLSYRGMANALDRDTDFPYLSALMDTYDEIDDHYPDLYELGIFDWWWVSKDKRQQFSSEEERKQRKLEEELDYILGIILKRLNRFDFKYVNRDILGRVYEDYLPKEERKKLGEYYTPLEVIQFMLDTADYKATNDIGQDKILDPACGSGGFLTEATERIIQHYLEKFNATSVHRLDGEQSKKILQRIENNVYGIDINPFAVHITQINLLFRTIDLYDKATEVDPNYSMDGFEIHVADTLTPTMREKRQGKGSQSQLQQFAEYNGRAKSFLDDRDAVDAMKDDLKFDVIVANPPYVRIQNLSEMKDTYSSRYSSAIKNFDIYIPFIERGLEWLTNNGRLTYICPNRIINADYAEEIREQLADEPITHLVDFREANVFDVPTPYPCVFSINRRQAVEDLQVNCARFAEKNDGALDKIKRLEDWSVDNPDGYELFQYSIEQLQEDNNSEVLPTWKPMPSDERMVFNQIDSAGDLRVADVMDEVFQGLATSADKVYTGHIVEEVNEELVEFCPAGSNESSLIEKEALRKLLKGSEIERWKIDWQGLWVIFPYNVAGDGANLLSVETLKQNYPHTWNFFNRYEDELKGRESGRMYGEDDWYGYIYPKNLVKFDPPKLILGVLRQEPSFVPDPEGEYYFVGGGTAGGYGMHVQDRYLDDEMDLLYFAAVLNSRVLEFYHKHISFIFNSKYYSYGRNFIEPHPLPEPINEIKQRVIELASKIRDYYDMVAQLGYKTSSILNYLPNYNRDNTLLDLVNSINLNDNDYRQDPIRKNDKTDAQSGVVYQVVMKRSHNLDFDSEEIRNFVYLLLKAQDKRLDRMEILEMDVPSKDDIRTLMTEFNQDKIRVEELEQEAESVQTDLDKIILKEVYNLDDYDREIIDSYLEIW